MHPHATSPPSSARAHTPIACLHRCVSFRTAFLRDGALIQDASRIAAHYLSGEFRADLLVSIPYVWVLQPLLNATGLPVAARIGEGTCP